MIKKYDGSCLHILEEFYYLSFINHMWETYEIIKKERNILSSKLQESNAIKITFSSPNYVIWCMFFKIQNI